MTTFAVLIMAAGEGTRFKSGALKQYMPLGNQTVLSYTIRNIFSSLVGSVQVVIGQKHGVFYEHSLKHLPKKIIDVLLPPVHGGERRQDSVRIGLENIENVDPDFVIIHDACRPLATLPDLDVIAQHLEHHSGVVPVLPPLDTISIVNDGILVEPVPRESVRIIQTPQIFRYRTILEYHKKLFYTCPEKHFTDDSSVLLSCGMSVTTVDGNYNNFKITTAEDIVRAECELKTRTMSAHAVYPHKNRNE